MSTDDIKKGPSLEEIIKKNWDLGEFISEGYLDGSDLVLGNKIVRGRKIPQLILKGNDPKILRAWAKEIDETIEFYYSRKSWARFREDLLMIHSNPGKLFLSGYKYSSWFKNGDKYVILMCDGDFNILITDKFEDVFYNILDTNSSNLEIVSPTPIDVPYNGALDVIYTEKKDDVETIVENLTNGKLIEISGFPLEMSISPLTEMTRGLFFMNNNYEFVVMGEIIDNYGKKRSRAETYDYIDGQRLISVLTLDENKWFYAVIEN